MGINLSLCTKIHHRKIANIKVCVKIIKIILFLFIFSFTPLFSFFLPFFSFHFITSFNLLQIVCSLTNLPFPRSLFSNSYSGVDQTLEPASWNLMWLTSQWINCIQISEHSICYLWQAEWVQDKLFQSPLICSCCIPALFFFLTWPLIL